MAAHGVAAFAATAEEVGHTGWEDVAHQLRQPQDGQWRLVRRLHHHRVACRQRRGQAGRSKHEGVVVGHDAGNHAQRFLQRVVEVAIAHGNGLALDLGGQAREVVQAVRSKACIHGERRHRVAVVERIELGKRHGMLAQHRGSLAQVASPLNGRRGGPGRKGRVRGANRLVHIGRIGDGGCGDGFVVGRVDGLEIDAGLGRVPGATVI